MIPVSLDLNREAFEPGLVEVLRPDRPVALVVSLRMRHCHPMHEVSHQAVLFLGRPNNRMSVIGHLAVAQQR